MYLRTPDSSVSNIILNLIPRETCVYIALLYLASGITNSEGLALIKSNETGKDDFKCSDAAQLECRTGID